MAYRFTSLTTELRIRHSPLRQFMHQRLPHRQAITRDLRPGDYPPVVRTGVQRGPSGTLGTAFEYAVRLWQDRSHVPPVALQGPESSEQLRVLLSVVRAAHSAAAGWDAVAAPPPALLRACWALALFTAAGRRGFEIATPLHELDRRGRLTAPAVLGLLPPDFADTMRSLLALAAHRLPVLQSEPSRLTLGPTFAASALCAADADFISDGCLWELKSSIGARRSDRIYLEAVDLYQLAGYVLFDTPDAFGINRIGLYQARFGRVLTWPVDEFFGALAGGPVDLAALRGDLWRLLGGGRPPETSGTVPRQLGGAAYPPHGAAPR